MDIDTEACLVNVGGCGKGLMALAVSRNVEYGIRLNKEEGFAVSLCFLFLAHRLAMASQDPVSYTHLTLPTNREV